MTFDENTRRLAGSFEPRAAPPHVDMRSRPGLFVAELASGGVTQLVKQLVDNVLDLHLAGSASRLEVSVHDDHICVCDDGPGIAARELAPGAGSPWRDPVFPGGPGGATWSEAERGVGGETPATVSGAHLGLSFVNSLARRLEIETCRHGARRRWVFESLRTVVAGERLGASRESGTCIRVWPDPEVFHELRPDPFALERCLLGIHRVRPSLRVELDGARFDEPAGTEAWLASQRCTEGLRIHHIEASRGTTELDLAWAWLPPLGSARCLSYVNLHETTGDGSHVEGLLTGLARVHDVPLALVRERVLALVSVIAVNPRFAGATHTRLDDRSLARWIADLVEHH